MCLRCWFASLLTFNPPCCNFSLLFFFFFIVIRPPPRSTLFPYTTLSRSRESQRRHRGLRARRHEPHLLDGGHRVHDLLRELDLALGRRPEARPVERRLTHRVDRLRIDRKSTRLNSSHSQISYAVFCLIKK